MRRYIALPLILLVVACTASMDLTPQQRVFAIKSEYDIALGQVVEYAELPRCTAAIVVACSDQEVVEKALDFAEDTKEGLNEAESAAWARNTCSGTASLLRYEALARSAVHWLTSDSLSAIHGSIRIVLY